MMTSERRSVIIVEWAFCGAKIGRRIQNSQEKQTHREHPKSVVHSKLDLQRGIEVTKTNPLSRSGLRYESTAEREPIWIEQTLESE